MRSYDQWGLKPRFHCSTFTPDDDFKTQFIRENNTAITDEIKVPRRTISILLLTFRRYSKPRPSHLTSVCHWMRWKSPARRNHGSLWILRSRRLSRRCGPKALHSGLLQSLTPCYLLRFICRYDMVHWRRAQHFLGPGAAMFQQTVAPSDLVRGNVLSNYWYAHCLN